MRGLDASDDKLVANNIKIKLPKQRYEQYDQQLNIKSFGSDNLYPQHLKALINGTPTAAVCNERLANFIAGSGIEGGDTAFVNRQQSVNDLVEDMARSLSMFRGIALHRRYNVLGQVVAVKVMPFETIRLGEDDDFGYIREYVYCADWSERQITQNKKTVNALTDARHYLPYSNNAADVVERMAKAGGVQNYAGDIQYVSNTGTYPVSPVDAVVTDMSTESGLQNISYRNSRNSFKPSAIICYKAGSEDSNRRFEATVKSMVGDEASSGVATIRLRDPETEMPKTLDLKATNFDKDFTATADKGEVRIYAAFKQDQFYLLRLGKVGFGGDIVSDVFNLMNVSVSRERGTIEKLLKQLADRWEPNSNPFSGLDLTIGDLVYNKTTGTIQDAGTV